MSRCKNMTLASPVLPTTSKWNKEMEQLLFWPPFFKCGYAKEHVLTCPLWWWSSQSQCHGTASRGQRTAAPPGSPPWKPWQQAQGLQHLGPGQRACQRSRKFAQPAPLNLNQCSAQNLQNTPSSLGWETVGHPQHPDPERWRRGEQQSGEGERWTKGDLKLGSSRAQHSGYFIIFFMVCFCDLRPSFRFHVSNMTSGILVSFSNSWRKLVHNRQYKEY